MTRLILAILLVFCTAVLPCPYYMIPLFLLGLLVLWAGYERWRHEGM
jgi:hypothetical protein